MVRDVFKEKYEYYLASLNTRLGWVDLILGNAIWGYIIMSLGPKMYAFFLKALPDSLGMFNTYIAYFLFGLATIPLSLGITYTIMIIFNKLFKNGDIV